MNIKLIAIDIDGTLLNDKGKILKATKNTIIEAQEKGIQVVLSTGRSPQATIDLAKELKIDKYAKYIICFNGCVIYNLQTKEKIWDGHLNAEDSKYIHNIVKKYQLNFWAYGLNNTAYIDKKDHFINHEAKVNKEYKVKVLKKTTLPECYKVLLLRDQMDDQFYESFYNEIILDERLQITMSKFLNFQLCEIMLANFNKGKALSFLCSKLGIKMKYVLALGDSLNDYEMLKVVKYGVMMKNGDPVLLKVVKLMTDNNNNYDGVGSTITDYVLQKNKFLKEEK